MVQKKPDDSKPVRMPVIYMDVARPWFIAIIASLIAPWLVLAAIWFKPIIEPRTDAVNVANTGTARFGKWGKLKLFPTVISPPAELVFTDWGFMRRPTWFFPGAKTDRVAQVLQSAGISGSDAANLLAGAQYEPRIAGMVLSPDPVWVRSLTPETRARIYHILAKSMLNVDQTQAFRYPSTNPEAWLGSSMISQHTRQLVEPLIYRDGGYMLFADIELVRAEIGSDEEIRRLGKDLLRQPTVIARLSVDSAAELDRIVEYWGRGGRRSEVRPLLESAVGGGADKCVDVIHLLPQFARNHLYCYPELSAAEVDKPTVINCLWTSLNFFLPNPDDRFLNAEFALKTLKESYYVVEADFELGDIVAFLDEEGNIFHAAVYIADDLVFCKNGISAMAPWTLMSINDAKGYYRWRSENPRLVFHRRKNI